MIRLLDDSKVRIIDFLLFFCMIIYSASATTFVREVGIWNELGNWVAIGLIIVMARLNKIHLFTKNYLVFITVFTIYTILNFVVNQYISIGFYFKWLILLTLATIIIKSYGKQFFAYYETIVYYLCIIALGFWAAFLFAPDTVVSFMKAHEFSTPFNEVRPTINIIVYTVITRLDYAGVNEFAYLPRNAGFAWEPGAFACFICFAIFCNIIRKNGLSLKNNRHLIIFLVALLSTQSTTGLSIFIIMLGIWMLLNNKHKVLAYFIIIPVIVYLFSLNFVSDKFLAEWNAAQNINALDAEEDDIGRIVSLKLAFEEFIHHPILGVGGNQETYLNSIGLDVSVFSGIGNLFSHYGVILAGLFFAIIRNSVQRISSDFETRYCVLLWVVLIGLMISYNIWNTPIIMSFWLYGFIMQDEQDTDSYKSI